MRITQNYLEQLELGQLSELANSQRVEVKLEYNSRMYDPETIEAILLQFNDYSAGHTINCKTANCIN